MDVFWPSQIYQVKLENNKVNVFKNYKFISIIVLSINNKNKNKNEARIA